MGDLLNDSSHLIATYAIPWGIDLVTALLVFVIGRWFVGLLVRGAKRMMQRAQLDEMLIKLR